MRPSPPPQVGARNPAGTSDTYAIERLLQQAADLGVRAPELALVLGERAASLAEAAGSDTSWVCSEGLVVSSRVQLGLRADSVARAVAALRAAEDLGENELAARLRTDLAVCARSVGVPLTGLAALRPVLRAEWFTGADKAAALCQLVGCLSQFGRKPELDRAFVEADKLCTADERLEGDARLVARAFLRVGMSAHRRRHADILGAADAARTGLGLLEQLDDPGCDGGMVRIRLILHLVCSLLDRGDSRNALEIAKPFLDAAPRAAAIAPLGWLRMSVATRILLPSGSVEAAAMMLRDAVHSTERHGLHALTSRLWAELSHVEHRLGRSSDAMECLHQARAAEHIYARSRRQAVSLLSGEFGTGGHAAVDLDDVLASIPHPKAPAGTPGSAPSETPVPAGGVADAEPVIERPCVRGQDQSVEPAVPDLPLAPAPADEPAPRFSLVFEPKEPKGHGPVQRATTDSTEASTTDEAAADATGTGVEQSTAREPLAARAADRVNNGSTEPDAKPRAGSRPDRPADAGSNRVGADRQVADESARRKTRHDSDHGSVAARSVLDRLGIAAGSGAGGRRRAPDAEKARQEGRAVGEESETVTAGAEAAPDASVAGAGTTETVSSGPVQAGSDTAEAPPAESANADSAPEAGAPEMVAAPASSDADGAGTAGVRAAAATERDSDTARGTPAASTRDPLSTGDSAPKANGSTVGAGANPSVVNGTGHGDTAAAAGVGQRTTGWAAVLDGGENAVSDPAAPADKDRDTPNGHAAAAKADDDATRSTAAGDRAEKGPSGSADTGATTRSAPGDESNAGVSENSPSADKEAGGEVADNWLPRLRLPPSLEPFENFTDEALAAVSDTHFTSTPSIEDDGLAGSSFLDEELPENAGLADLLARALAEHRAGTSSAAALVKRLGTGTEVKRPVNGHSHNGEAAGNGRHRTDG